MGTTSWDEYYLTNLALKCLWLNPFERKNEKKLKLEILLTVEKFISFKKMREEPYTKATSSLSQ
jgi:hypothetical protein